MAVGDLARIATAGVIPDPVGSALFAPGMPIVVHGEENGGIAAGQDEWSTGNGSVGQIGHPLLVDCELVGFSLNAETVTSGANCSIEVKDRSATKAGIVLATFATTALSTTAPNYIETLTTPAAAPAGTVVGFRTAAVSGTITDVRVFAWLRTV